MSLRFDSAPPDYRIEKRRHALHLRMTDGTVLHGEIFVQRSAQRHSGREEPIDIFNAADPFFPIQADGGDVTLVAKDRVSEVWGVEPTQDDELRLASARTVELDVTLVGGASLIGTLFLELPHNRARLLDFLNRLTDRFVSLHTAEGLRLINTKLIQRVRPLD